MSETRERQPRKIRVGLVPVLALVGLLVGVAVWVALSQGGTATGPATPVSTPTASASPEPSASATPTTKPLPTAEVALTANLGPGYELQDEHGNPASLCEAVRFAAPFNPDYGTFTVARDSGPSVVETAEGVVDFSPVSNTESDGFFGLFQADC